MAGVYTLGKNERLKSRKAIEELFASGKKFSQSFYLVYYRLIDHARKEPLQFGVGVSSKQFKNAVDRNRIKRLTKEAYRLQKNSLREKLADQKKFLDLFFIYTGKDIPGYDEVYPAIGAVIKKLERLFS